MVSTTLMMGPSTNVVTPLRVRSLLIVARSADVRAVLTIDPFAVLAVPQEKHLAILSGAKHLPVRA